MRIEDEALGDMMREVAAGWPSDEFVQELRLRRHAERKFPRSGLAVIALGGVAVAVAWFIHVKGVQSDSGHAMHPHGAVRVSGHQCDSADDVEAAFRSAVEAEALGDSECAVRNFYRVVALAQPEHATCSVADHPVDAQVAIARWELAQRNATR